MPYKVMWCVRPVWPTAVGTSGCAGDIWDVFDSEVMPSRIP